MQAELNAKSRQSGRYRMLYEQNKENAAAQHTFQTPRQPRAFHTTAEVDSNADKRTVRASCIMASASSCQLNSILPSQM